MFSFGIEHEEAFLKREGGFADYNDTAFEAYEAIIEKLPLYPSDYPQLRVGDAGIKRKRWYIEGFERYNDQGKVTSCPPKGIEIRTTIHRTIQSVIEELSQSYHLLNEEAALAGFLPALTSFHPYRAKFEPEPPLNAYEQERRLASPEKRTAFLPMLTYGPDLNLSLSDLRPAEVIDIGRKLTYYSPFIIPFSFSSPFYQGKLWQGLSVRTFIRTGVRPAALVFMERPEELISSNPSLTKIARLPAEVGRIEFKACDSCFDFAIYAGLLALLKGLILDKTLEGRLTVPDAALHQLSARQGFASDEILTGTRAVLAAAELALSDDEDRVLLRPLRQMFEQRTTPAHALIEAYKASGSIEEALRGDAG